MPIDYLKNKRLRLHYRRWQLTQMDPNSPPMINSVEEFSQFCKNDSCRERARNFDTNGERIGSKCGHLVHPILNEDCEYCPVCEVVVRLNLLQHIAEAWNTIGGPWSVHQRGKKHRVSLHAWRTTRLNLETLVARYRDIADEEARWEREYPKEVEASQKTLSAAKAVVVAEFMSRYPASVQPGQHSKLSASNYDILNSDVGHLPLPPSTPHVENKTHVTFATETNFEPGRPSEMFERTSDEYVPGRHAASTPDGLVNTSHLSNTFFNALQLKVVTNKNGVCFDALTSAISAPEDEGIAAQHAHWPAIHRHLFDGVRGNIEKDKMLCQALQHADYLFVRLNEKEEVSEVIPYAKQDEGNSQALEPTIPNRRWISYGEILPYGMLDDIQSLYRDIVEDDVDRDRWYDADDDVEVEDEIAAGGDEKDSRVLHGTKKRKFAGLDNEPATKRMK